MSDNSALANTLSEFNAQILNNDFQRTNMFSVYFATKPKSKSQEYLGAASSDQEDDSIQGTLDVFGATSSNIQKAIASVITMGAKQIVRQSGVKKYVMGAMSNRVVSSLMGDMKVGAETMEYFDTKMAQVGLLVQSCKIPDNHLNHEMDRQYNSPNIKIMGRDFEPFILTFRMDSKSQNFRAFNDWVNAVEDPVTGLRGLPIDIESDIQVNLHDRKGIPHTVYFMHGCIPVVVGGPQVSYEDNNQITTFDVTFAYRNISVGGITEAQAKEWKSNAMTTNDINTKNNDRSSSRLSRN